MKIQSKIEFEKRSKIESVGKVFDLLICLQMSCKYKIVWIIGWMLEVRWNYMKTFRIIACF